MLATLRTLHLKRDKIKIPILLLLLRTLFKLKTKFQKPILESSKRAAESEIVQTISKTHKKGKKSKKLKRSFTSTVCTEEQKKKNK